MRISKKFMRAFIRTAEKAFNTCQFAFEVFIGGTIFQIHTNSCLIVPFDGTTVVYNSCKSYKDCVQWFFNHFSIAELREAKIYLPA